MHQRRKSNAGCAGQCIALEAGLLRMQKHRSGRVLERRMPSGTLHQSSNKATIAGLYNIADISEETLQKATLGHCL